MQKNSINTSISRIAVMAGLTVLATSFAQAQWLTHTGGGASATGVFHGGTGDYAGTVKSTIKVYNDGGNNGVVGLAAGSFSNLTSAFTSNYMTNMPGGSFNTLNLAYNHTRDQYLVTMDFSGLANGYLPYGTTMVVADLDIWEDLVDMRAWDDQGNLLGVGWLGALMGQADFLDYNNDDGYQTNLTPWSVTTNGVSGTYNFIGIDHNESSGLDGYLTLARLSRIEFVVQKHVSGDFDHNGGSGIGFASCVPEPTTMAAVALGLFGMGGRRRKRVKQ